MKEYTFLMTTSFRSEHIKAHTLREAFKKVKIWHEYHKNFGSEQLKKNLGDLNGSYQDAKDDDFVMSGWKQIKDKKIIKQLKNIF